MQFYSWIFVYAFYLNPPFLTCLPYALTNMATHMYIKAIIVEESLII